MLSTQRILTGERVWCLHWEASFQFPLLEPLRNPLIFRYTGGSLLPWLLVRLRVFQKAQGELRREELRRVEKSRNFGFGGHVFQMI